MTAIAIIPARGGSKGIPNKNLALLGRYSLLEWTVSAAVEAQKFFHVVVSTDSERIAKVAQNAGAEVSIRPPELAQDDTPTMPVVLHALSGYDARTVVVLQPTSPFRGPEDIVGALDLHYATRRSVVSVTEAKPWVFSKSADGTLTPAIPVVSQRQAVNLFAPNGAIYVASASRLMSGGTWWDDAIAYEMTPERSIDIDTPLDMLLAQSLLAQKEKIVSESDAYRMAAV